MYTKPTAPRSIGGVLDGAFSLWMPILKRTWPLIVIPKLVSSVLVIPQLTRIAALSAGAMPNLGGGPWVIQILSAVVSLVFLGFYTAMIARADDTVSGGTMSLGESLKVGFKFWLRAFLLVIIMGIVLVPALLPMLLAANSLQGGQFPSWKWSGGVGLMFFAYVLFLTFLFGRLFLAFVALVLEDQGAWSSLRISWNLTRNYWWRCAAILTVLVIVTYVVVLIGGVVLAIFGIKNGIQAGIFSLPVLIATQLLGLLVGVLFTPLFLGGLLSTYYDLKLRKEGGDLAERVAALGSFKT